MEPYRARISGQLICSFGLGGALAPVLVYPGQERALGVGVAPGICLEPPAPHRYHQGSQVAVLAGTLERGVQVAVVALQQAASAFAASTARIAAGVQAGRGRCCGRLARGAVIGSSRRIEIRAHHKRSRRQVACAAGLAARARRAGCLRG